MLTIEDPYGSTESTRVDGEGVSALLTWDSKVLTVVSILGGIKDLVRDRMKSDGIYDEFVRIAEVRPRQRHYGFLGVLLTLRRTSTAWCLTRDSRGNRPNCVSPRSRSRMLGSTILHLASSSSAACFCKKAIHSCLYCESLTKWEKLSRGESTSDNMAESRRRSIITRTVTLVILPLI